MANRMTTSNGMNLAIGMTFNTQQARQDLNTKLRQLEQKAIVKTTVEIDGERFVKTIRTYQDSMKNLVEETTLWNGAGKQMTSTITNLTNAEERVNAQIAQQERNTKSLTQSQNKLNSVTKHSISLFTDFANTFLKMAKFNTINMIYDGLTNSLSNAVKIVEDFNQATTELKKVSDLEGESLKAYSKDLIDYGEAVGRTLTDMVNSATIFKRTGATDEDAAKLAQIAELYRNVADEEITSAEASSFLVSQMKAFNYTADESIHVIDALNKTANEHAVSTNDLQIALSKSAAALATAGNTYEQTIAMVEGATAVMQNNAGTVGNGLRTIAINIANLATASDNFVAANGKVNISLKDERGEIRGTYEILNDLSQSWSTLSKAEQNEIAVSLSGKTRYNVLTSLMRNFSDAQQTLVDALNSTNSAWNENARYMESIASKHARIQAEIQKFVLGEGGLEDLEKKLLDIGISLLKFLNQIGGLKTALSTLSTVLAVGLVPQFIKLITSFKNLFGFFPALISHFKYAQQAGVSFSVALKEIATSSALAQAALQGMVAAIGIAITAYTMYQQAQEQAKEAAHDANEKAIEQAELIQQQILKLKEENQSRQDLIQAIQGVDSAYKDEGQSIDELNKKRQESIDKLNEEREAKLKDAKESGQAQYLKDKKTLNKTYKPSRQLEVEAGYYGITLQTDGIENYINSLKELRVAENNANVDTSHLNKVIGSLETEFEDAQKGIVNYDNVLYQLGAKYDDTTGKIVGLSQKELVEKQAAEEVLDVKEKAIGMFAELGVNIEEVQNVLDEDAFNNFLDAINNNDLESAIAILKQYGIEVQNVGNSSQESESAISSFLSTADDLQSAYEVLNKAAEEYNKNGYISAATLKKLAKLDSEYQAQLQITNGTMTVTNGALQDQFNLSKQLAIIHAKTETETEALAYAQGYLADNIVTVGFDSKESQPKVSELSQAFTDLGHATQEANKGIWAVRNALGDEEALEKFNKGLEEIYNRGAKRVENLEGIELDYVSSSKSSASSHKDAWVEAFKEEQRQLKHSLEMNEITEIEYYQRLKDLNEKYFGEISGKHEKYIKEYQENEEEIYKGTKAVYDKVKNYLKEAVENGYEKAINALKKEEKAVLAEIKKQLEALKDEKKKVLDNIKDEINALKREKEQVQKYYNDQIDAIKKENEVLQEQNQLLEYQQKLQEAKAKKVMVMQNGKFQLTEDESAVSQAEQNLSNYQDQLSYEQQIQQLEDLRDAQVEAIESRIQSLEEYYDYMEEYYDKQIESMEEYSNRVQEQYEKQIEALQTELDTFKEGYQKAEDLENAKLAASVLAANEEAAVWQTRLENLANAVSEYNRLIAMIGEEGATTSSAYQVVQAQAQTSSHVAEADASITTRASGDASFKNDEIALVGESPNTELVIGSRLNQSVNSGTLMHLAKGSGVVNAESTQTLAGLLNGLSTPSIANSNRSVQQNFNFGTLSLPNVSNAETFVGALRDKFNNYSIQYSTKKQ